MHARIRPTRPLTLTLVALSALGLGSPALAGGDSITLTPANSIQAAINSGLYGEIILAEGTYAQTVDFNGGAVTLRSTNPDDPAVVAATVIDGSFLGTSVLICDDGEGPDTQIVGLTITGGEANGSVPNDRGGGLRCWPGSPTVDRCVFIGNEAVNFGGGMYVSAGSPTIIGTTFTGNVAGQGGGAYLNFSTEQVTLSDCVFDGNDAPTAGGGLRTQGGTVMLDRVTFVGNQTDVAGGGLYANNTVLAVQRTRFTGNVAERGGAVYTLSESSASTITDSVIDDNEAIVTGGGFYFRTPMTVRNCTFVGNTVPGTTSSVDAASSVTQVVSSVFWGNNGGSPVGGAGTVNVTRSLVEGGEPGAGNVDTDPIFLAAGDGDYRLASNSPAIDAGDSSVITDPYPVDFDGLPRATNRTETSDTGLARLGLTVDMGAFEFQPEGSGNPNCPADLDLSGDVDFADLLQVLSAFGSCP
ncbi:MAG: choice-of-anchor Q domain-containing protein [Phycisphaerales bacterium]